MTKIEKDLKVDVVEIDPFPLFYDHGVYCYHTSPICHKLLNFIYSKISFYIIRRALDNSKF